MRYLSVAALLMSSLLLGQSPAFRNLPLPRVPSLPNVLDLPRGRAPHGETKRETYNFLVGDVNRINVTIAYGLGELNIESNINPNEIEGWIEYSPRFLSPEVEYRTLGSKGKLEIRVRSHKVMDYDRDYDYDEEEDEEENKWSFDFDWKGIRDGEYESTADFRLPRFIPMDISMDFGLGEATVDLSDLSISDFDLDCGLSDTRIKMSTPNPVSSRKVRIESGLGDFNGEGLGNLRMREFRLDVGVGSAEVDLRGDLTEDMEADVQVGLGSLDLTLPRNVNIRLSVDRSFLSSVDVSGLVREDDDWVSRDWDFDRPTIEMEISVGLGSVDVDVR